MDRGVGNSPAIGGSSEDDRHDEAKVRQLTNRNAGAREHDRRRRRRRLSDGRQAVLTPLFEHA
jgi:hypothetical protein